MTVLQLVAVATSPLVKYQPPSAAAVASNVRHLVGVRSRALGQEDERAVGLAGDGRVHLERDVRQVVDAAAAVRGVRILAVR